VELNFKLWLIAVAIKLSIVIIFKPSFKNKFVYVDEVDDILTPTAGIEGTVEVSSLLLVGKLAQITPSFN
jgi:hypothetical protein